MGLIADASIIRKLVTPPVVCFILFGNHMFTYLKIAHGVD